MPARAIGTEALAVACIIQLAAFVAYAIPASGRTPALIQTLRNLLLSNLVFDRLFKQLYVTTLTRFSSNT